MSLGKGATRLLERPFVYRAWQRPFVEQKLAPIQRRGDIARARRVLDVGCGPGTNAPYFSRTEYLGVDINPRYIADARSRFTGKFVVADVMDYRASDEGTFDFILVNSLLHHINTESVRRLLAHLAELLTEDGHIHIIDLVLPKRRSVARHLALMDRGEFPRPVHEWSGIFEEAFDVEVFEPFSLAMAGLSLWELVYCKAGPPGARPTTRY